jgi:hypothetical protein
MILILLICGVYYPDVGYVPPKVIIQYSQVDLALHVEKPF